MVYRMNDAGTAGWYEPPYTEEEEMMIHRPAPGPVTVYLGQWKPGERRPAINDMYRKKPETDDGLQT